jgi:hypothetical protein
MGLRGQQVAVFGVTLLLVLVAMWTAPPPVNVAVAFLLVATAAAICFVPMSGRTAEQWAPVVVRWTWRRATGRHRFRSRLPVGGHASGGTVTAELPGSLRARPSCRLLCFPAG